MLINHLKYLLLLLLTFLLGAQTTYAKTSTFEEFIETGSLNKIDDLANAGSKLVDNLNLGNFSRKIGDYDVFDNGEVFYRAMNQPSSLRLSAAILRLFFLEHPFITFVNIPIILSFGNNGKKV